jgi:putative hemolysin
VTSEDIFQTIVGDLPEEGDEPKWQSTELPDGSWMLDGHMPIDEFFDMFSQHRDLDDGGSYNTLAGFILAMLEKIPAVGEKFSWNGLSIEVIELERQRIDKVKVVKESDIEH